MRVRELMEAAPPRLMPDMTLAEAASALERAGVGGAPVVDGEGRVIGMVTGRDLLAQAQAYAAVPRLTGVGGTVEDLPPEVVRDAYREGWTRPVREVMSWPVHTVRADDALVTAADQFVTHDVRRLPVVDGSARLVGLVTREALLSAVARWAGPEPLPVIHDRPGPRPGWRRRRRRRERGGLVAAAVAVVAAAAGGVALLLLG